MGASDTEIDPDMAGSLETEIDMIAKEATDRVSGKKEVGGTVTSNTGKVTLPTPSIGGHPSMATVHILKGPSTASMAITSPAASCACRREEHVPFVRFVLFNRQLQSVLVFGM